MASNLRVDQITSSTTGSVSIGTATFTGGLSGDITGLNVTGVITATTLNQNVSGVVTATSFDATSNITVGDSFINATSIGIGTTTTAGRNAGVSTAVGSLIYNSTDGELQVWTGSRWDTCSNLPFSATSPTVTADTASRPGWAVFSFTSPGSLVVSGQSGTVEYLVVAGGGGTGQGTDNREAGSGAGGMQTGSLTLSPGTYPVTVGAGGAGGVFETPNNGAPSVFNTVTSVGGGGGGSNDPAPTSAGRPGGSGGGAWYINSPGGGAGTPGQGNPGGPGFGSPEYGGAGGGAGGAGGRGTTNGPGSPSSITGSPVTYAAGGVSSNFPGVNRTANGTANTGNGGSGSGSGGSGIVIIAYQTS